MHENYDSEIQHQSNPGNFPTRLGIIGGGQLARMTALAALPLGCEVVVLEKNPLSPAARLSPDSMVGDWNNPATLLTFAARCDVITLENEFVDAKALAVLEAAGHPVIPSSACIALTQDKFVQKQTLQDAGLAVPPCRAVDSPEDILAAAKTLGWPLVLKARRNGYDGKGNVTLRSEGCVEAGWRHLGGGTNPLFIEAFFPFTKELAAIVTRGRDGETAVYPVVETIQENHICRLVKAPAAISDIVAQQATEVARNAVCTVGGVGTFGVEMFLSAEGRIVVNELAPRVHNSGHYTIEACDCSQFENHVRAVLGLPLGSTRMLAPAAVMVNLIGDRKASGHPRGLENALRRSGVRFHLYGKAMCGPGRKMGHITVMASSLKGALAKAERAAADIYFETKQ